MTTKYIFVTGGVVSGLGKGIVAASLGRLLKDRGLKVKIQKFDPYLNIDPGTMNPYQHGEVFVTDDGAETDLDLGHYERFIDEKLTVNSSVTSGKVYWDVLHRERNGEYLGGTVQVIPHITDEIKRRICDNSDSNPDIVITEIGGTVGDIESQAFIEAIRQIGNDLRREDVMYIHVSLVVSLPGSNELKTKATQHSCKELLSVGIQPDVIICRSDQHISKDIRRKIAQFCNVSPENVISNANASILYEVPLMLEAEGLADAVTKRLNLGLLESNSKEWSKMVERAKISVESVTIGLVGKYVDLHDAYYSVIEALTHGGIENDVKVDIRWIDAEEINEKNIEEMLEGCNGIIVPGGFGERGIEGKISSIRWARENHIPFFGICLGMQMAVVEFARNVANLADAHSNELNPSTTNPVIDLMLEQQDVEELGGTMRLGAYACNLLDNRSRSYQAYGEDIISERHRHRYEFNNAYRDMLTEAGLSIVGLSPNHQLVEIVELKNHPWFVGVQFHPEFKSRPNRAHPLFRDFVKAAVNNSKK